MNTKRSTLPDIQVSQPETKEVKYSIITAVICGSALTAHAWDSTENATWLDGYLKGQLTDTVSVKLAEQLRYKDEGSFNHYRHTEFGAEWSFAKNWSASAAYRYIQARKPDSEWFTKPMVHINLKNKTSLWLFDLKTCLRFSYLFLDGAVDLSDCRPKFALMPFQGWTGWNFKPYAAFEGMYNFEANVAYRYRAGAGLLLTPVNKLSLNLFMMQEQTRLRKNNDWQESYYMGLQAGLKF